MRPGATRALRGTWRRGTKDRPFVGLGLDVDVMPYVLSGAHVDAWVGRDGWRVPTRSEIDVGTQSWHPARFSPAIGLKLGWNVLL
jgi:hypothetical protein